MTMTMRLPMEQEWIAPLSVSVIGIVGAEAAKFTEGTQTAARQAIRSMLNIWQPILVVSGRSPLGGIDWWAIEEAEALCIGTREYEPKTNSWEGEGGFRDRNLAIARASDLVVCITVKVLPAGFRGRRFERGCYHCHTPPEDHVKSGGCWTMHRAGQMGKRTVLVIIDPEDEP